MATASVAAIFFGSKYERARKLLQGDYMPILLSKSQFSRHLHRVDYLLCCSFLGARRNKLYRDEAYRDYRGNMKPYCYGQKILLLVTEDH